MNPLARISGACFLSLALFAAAAFAADPPRQGTAAAPGTTTEIATPQNAVPEAEATKEFQYGPIHSADPEVRAQIKKLYRDQAELDQSANAQIETLVKSLETVDDSEFQLHVQQEIMATKKELTIKSMEIGLQIAKLNQDEQRVTEYEKALDQMLHPEKYLPPTQDPSYAEERARQMGLK